MTNLSKKAKVIITIISVLLTILVVTPFVLYLKVLPEAVSNPEVISLVQKKLEESMELTLVVKEPVLKTKLAPVVGFNVKELTLSKNKEPLLDVKNFDTQIEFPQIFDSRIRIKKLGADYVFADVNKLMALAPSEPQKKQKSEFYVDVFHSLLYVKKCLILYKIDDKTFVRVDGNDIEITERKNPKFVHFNIVINLKKGSENLRLSLQDKDNVYIKDRKLIIDNAILGVNKSNVFISSVSDERNNFDLTVFSKKFDVKNVTELLDSNLLIPDGDKMLAFFKDINGNFDFDINITNKDMNGKVKLNKLNLKVLPLNALPVTVTNGDIKIDAKQITLSNFNGFYGKQAKNKLQCTGSIKDYMKSVDTEIVATGIATNELTKNYLSKMIGYPLELTGDSGMKMIVKSVYNKIDLSWMFKIAKGNDILVDGASLSPVNYDRAVKADIHFEGNTLNIKSINYYIASVINKQSKIKPILTLDGNLEFVPDSPYPVLKNLGFNIPKPLPSEFLNVLIGQKLFKKGTIAGHMQVVNTDKYPVLDGNLAMDKVRIPSQRLSIKEGRLTTENGMIKINALGRFKRTAYNFNGKILNEIKLPVVIKSINLSIDDLNVEKILASFNNQNTAAVSPVIENTEQNPTLVTVTDTDEENSESDDAYTFDTGLLIVEECILNVAKGAYKDLKFGNLHANLTLNKSGILEVKSNKFDFNEGISTLKVYCDLMKHKYSIRLGAKDINSDILATTLLSLPREISGKSSGLIELYTDDSLKLNGSIKFAIKNGTIAKIGLVEYAMKFASLFRNPLAMISPSTVVDLVNIPEGTFEKINGELVMRDNVVEKIMIKSSSPQLSSFIVGRYDLENSDATLRIYTKFSSKNRGFAGFMRNISLNSLANRVPLSSRNDSNFYSAELEMLPKLEDETDAQVFLTKVDGDVEHFNFLSSLKKIK